jgi:hypothetical protein
MLGPDFVIEVDEVGVRAIPPLAPQKATNQQTRLFNHQLVLRTIYDRSPLSRADVARATGLTRTTVSDVVEQLIGPSQAATDRAAGAARAG